MTNCQWHIDDMVNAKGRTAQEDTLLGLLGSHVLASGKISSDVEEACRRDDGRKEKKHGPSFVRIWSTWELLLAKVWEHYLCHVGPLRRTRSEYTMPMGYSRSCFAAQNTMHILNRWRAEC